MTNNVGPELITRPFSGYQNMFIDYKISLLIHIVIFETLKIAIDNLYKPFPDVTNIPLSISSLNATTLVKKEINLNFSRKKQHV